MNPTRSSAHGFTLLELLAAVAIVAILAGVALPQYKDYVTRSRLTDATVGLTTLRAQMERYFQDNRTYANSGSFVAPCNSSDVATRTFGNFVITCTGTLDGAQFTLSAEGGGASAGFTYTINQRDERATTTLPSGWGSACGSKWIVKKGDTC